MSLHAIPKPSSIRPPVPPLPPVGFFPGPGESEEPVTRRLEENVNRLIQAIRRTPDEHLAPTLDLIRQRRRWIDQELTAIRLLERTELPPSAFVSLAFDDGEPDEGEKVYLRLLSRLEDVERTVRERMARHSPPVDPSSE